MDRWSTKQLVTMALLGAIAIVLSFIEFPIIPAAPFLKLDLALVPTTVVGFAYGAGPGALVAVVYAVAHAAITGNWVGALMNIIAACSFVIPASVIYTRIHSYKGALIGLLCSVLCLIAASTIANIIIDPLFYGMPQDAVIQLIVPALIPFNLIKGIAVSILTLIVYKSISNLITPQKDQVKGR